MSSSEVTGKIIPIRPARPETEVPAPQPARRPRGPARANRGARMAPKLRAEITQLSQLTAADRSRMFELMQKYYHEVTREQFLADLSKKDAVIILRDEEHWRIQGFSTLLKLSGRIGTRKVRGIFSGDTIIEKAFWGQTALGKAFLKYLWLEKARHPLQPLYWLLISKGYKTYLMMANNFQEYYPRFDRPTPRDRKRLLDAFYSKLYPGYFKPESGLIRFDGAAPCRLKEDVAPIDPSLIESNPKIAFFQERNPLWTRGEELACLARMTLLMPLQYSLKCLFKKLVGRAKPAPDHRPSAPIRQLRRREQES